MQGRWRVRDQLESKQKVDTVGLLVSSLTYSELARVEERVAEKSLLPKIFTTCQPKLIKNVNLFRKSASENVSMCQGVILSQSFTHRKQRNGFSYGGGGGRGEGFGPDSLCNRQ